MLTRPTSDTGTPTSDVPSDTERLDQSRKPAFGIRVAEINALAADGTVKHCQRKIPTLPTFDHAFGAFAQGTVFQADDGFVAVEDLLPGDRLTTAEGQISTVTWIGSTRFAPGDLGAGLRLTRIMPDSFGPSRPDSFISLGRAARLLQTPPDLLGSSEAGRVMTPAAAFVDGVNIIDVSPPTAVRMFHVALDRHAALVAGGIEVESFHPGRQPTQSLSQTLQEVYLSCFPHVTSLADFGPIRFVRAQEAVDQTAA